MRNLTVFFCALFLIACEPLDSQSGPAGPQGLQGVQGAMGAPGVPGRDGVGVTSPILLDYTVGAVSDSTQTIYAAYLGDWSAVVSNRKVIFVPAGLRISHIALNLRDKPPGRDIATLEVQEGASFQAVTQPLQLPAKAQLTGAEQSIVVMPGSTLSKPWVSLVLTLTGPDSYTGNVEAFVWASP